jgi:hypothetical protein
MAIGTGRYLRYADGEKSLARFNPSVMKKKRRDRAPQWRGMVLAKP